MGARAVERRAIQYVIPAASRRAQTYDACWLTSEEWDMKTSTGIDWRSPGRA